MRPSLAVRAGLLGLIALCACYTLVFVSTTGDRWPSALLDALINVCPLALWAAVFFEFNRRWLLHRPARFQAPLHLASAASFAVLWYFTVTILLGWRSGDFAGSFSVRPFSSIAFTWQMFQGAVTYALVAALALIDVLIVVLRGAIAAEDAPEAGEPMPSETAERRILVRGEDELVAVPVDDIVCIERAGDYARLVTSGAAHLTRKSLAELERQLPDRRFVRVHRSHLISLDALETAEPIGGGRMRVRLKGGLQIDTSRGGARLLRQRAG
jgi:hypothetical protein